MAGKKKQGNDAGLMGQRNGVQHWKEKKLII